MQVVLDSSSFNALATKPKTKGGKKPPRRAFGTNLDDALRSGRLCLVMDDKNCLFDEWARTANIEIAQILFTTWFDWDAIELCQAITSIPRKHNRYFRRNAWITDAGDRLVLRIALACAERNIVSEDSDFWDPRNPKNRGKDTAPVARYLREELEIVTYRLREIMADLAKGS